MFTRPFAAVARIPVFAGPPQRRVTLDPHPDFADATVLFVAFPDLAERWEADEAETSELVRRAHAAVAAAVAAHGGTEVPALVDARSAVFPKAAAAARTAAAAVAREAGRPGAVPAAIGLASGPVPAGPFAAWSLYNHARAMAELAGPGSVLLAKSTAERVAGDLPPGVRLVDPRVQWLPDLQVFDRVARLAVTSPGSGARGRPGRLVARLRRVKGAPR